MNYSPQEAKSEVEAKKLIKCIIKIIIKLGILYSNEKLSPNEKQLLKQMIRNFSKLIMTLVTFWEVRVVTILSNIIQPSNKYTVIQRLLNVVGIFFNMFL